MISPGKIDSSLVDFTDFLPTLAEATGITIPGDYGIMDGKSFYNHFLGDFSIKRDWVFTHFQPAHEEGESVSAIQEKLVRWANTAQYKLYDSTHNFYNIVKDPKELKPLTRLTKDQTKIKADLQAVIDSMHN